MSTWTQLISDREVKKHSTSKEEIDNLLAVVSRDIQDASLQGLSADRRFATAYNAALQLCKLSIACAGYRVTSNAHHQKSFEIADLALGKSAYDFTSYFEYCRRKRNVLDYDKAGVVTEDESMELLEKVNEFENFVVDWLKNKQISLI